MKLVSGAIPSSDAFKQNHAAHLDALGTIRAAAEEANPRGLRWAARFRADDHFPQSGTPGATLRERLDDYLAASEETDPTLPDFLFAAGG